VEGLAARALSLTRTVSGADVFVGFSFGGLVALEMARLARAAGDADARAILIDAVFAEAHWPPAMRRRH
jgi:thioesterase domain-containing protein